MLLECLFIAENEGEFRVAAAMYDEGFKSPNTVTHALIQAGDALECIRRFARSRENEELSEIAETFMTYAITLQQEIRDVLGEVAELESDCSKLSERCREFIGR